MQKVVYAAGLLLGFAGMSVSALAHSTSCSGMNGALQYQAYSQEGGPCCGRGSSSLKFNGIDVKTTSYIGGGRGSAGSNTDSNPNLIVLERQVQLISSTVSGTTRTVKYSGVLDITSQDGQPALPDGDSAVRSIPVACASTSSTVPIP